MSQAASSFQHSALQQYRFYFRIPNRSFHFAQPAPKAVSATRVSAWAGSNMTSSCLCLHLASCICSNPLPPTIVYDNPSPHVCPNSQSNRNVKRNASLQDKQGRGVCCPFRGHLLRGKRFWLFIPGRFMLSPSCLKSQLFW